MQKHAIKYSARLTTYDRIRTEAVDLLRAEAALHLLVDVDVACLSGQPKGKGKSKDKGKSKADDLKGKGTSKGKIKKGKETRVCHECHQPWTSATGLQCVQEARGREGSLGEC